MILIMCVYTHKHLVLCVYNEHNVYFMSSKYHQAQDLGVIFELKVIFFLNNIV
jgi:hypothetical protein